MRPVIQFNSKKLILMTFPFCIPNLTFSRSLAVKKCYTDLMLNFDSTGNNVRKKYTHRNLCSNIFNSSRLDDESFQDDEQMTKDSSDLDENFETFKFVCDKQEQFIIAQLQAENNRTSQITNEEWDTVKSSVLQFPGILNEKNIDAVILNKCDQLKFLSLGKSYFSYLRSKNEAINLACFGNYLRLFYSCKNDCTKDDLNEIMVVYKELIETYPILDWHTAEKAVCALCLTENWKEYEKLFVAIKKFYNPSVNIYQIVILTAFEHQEFDLGWKLMEEMQYQGSNVPDEVFLQWFQKVKLRKLEEDVLRVLNFLNYFNIKPSDEFCRGLKKAFEYYNENGRVTLTNIQRNGECRSCHTKLETCLVSQEDFDELKEAFLNPVIIGKDIFRKTKPQEFEDFLRYLEEKAPFDIVLDGLNIAHQGGEKTISMFTSRLKSVVKYFLTLNKKMLLLGRKHMASWKTPDMDFVCKNAFVFFTDNVSQDDPFMLYATLHSGLGTCFVSRDMMRGHKFLLANPKLQLTFQKWQSTHQLFITHFANNGRVIFQEPVSFLQTVQQSSKGDWHVPFYVKGEDLSNRSRVDHLHRHWMCMQKISPAREIQRPDRRMTQVSKSVKEYWNERPKQNTELKYNKTSTGKINLKKIFED